ncbi:MULTISPECIES: HlyC/CorC family transporter [Nitrincola]|uniref:Magnesium and cobalt efflux protein CorC n=1 Tax=Nitrincola nitratireducens TaxID=1229521 RepID=W9UZU8_9GAMM|nr:MULTISPECIES: transporter associated domain-containing protein [Nitrincola]EXJ09372.1 Magnesium and cobalt efflux protein CorC [Nitrincola nitratireducens]
MSEERSGSATKGWLGKLAQAFSDEPPTREALIQGLYDAAEAGVLDNDALNIIEGAMQVSDMKVRDAMVPRSQVTMVQINQAPREFLPIIIETAHSRFPVCGENPDEVIGILLAKDLLNFMLDGNLDNFSLQDCIRPAVFVPEGKRLNVLLREFRGARNHMAVVVDEYGGVSGLITIEDVLEQIVGEIEDEHDDDDDEGNIKALDEQSYLVKALTTIEDFNDHFNSHFSDDEFDTIGGLVTQRFGRLPQKGEQVSFEHFNFTVLSADNRRIRLLQVEQS